MLKNFENWLLENKYSALTAADYMGRVERLCRKEGYTLAHLVENIASTIDDPEKLGEAMIKYFEEHQAEILEKTRETNQKKSQSKIGNQHAKKDESIKETPKLGTNEDILREYPVDYYNYPEKIKEAVANNPKDSCDLDFYLELYKKSAGEYFYWFIGNKWIRIMDKKSSSTLEKIGYDIDKAKEEEQNILLKHLQY